MLELGREPDELKLHLSPGADFISTIYTLDGSTWPVTLQAKIIVGGETWTATVAGDELRWNVDKAAVDSAIAAKPVEAWLRYVDGSTDLLWAYASRVFIDG